MNNVIRTWTQARQLPTPGIRLVLLVRHGDRVIEIEGQRPEYVASYEAEPNYQDLQGNHLKGVMLWTHK